MARPNEGDIYLDAARGKEGYSYVHKFGHTPNASTTSNPVWSEGGAYTYLTTATAGHLIIASDDTDDTAADTGARTVQIWGLDVNYAEQNEVVTMKGFVAATTTLEYLRVFRMAVIGVGSSTYNEGKITALPDAAGNTFTAAGVPTSTANILAAIQTTTSQTRMAMYTVPASYTAYLVKAFGSCSEDNEIQLQWVQRNVNESFKVKGTYHMYRSNWDYDPKIPIPIPAMTDIEIRAAGSSSSADVAVGFNLLLINE